MNNKSKSSNQNETTKVVSTEFLSRVHKHCLGSGYWPFVPVETVKRLCSDEGIEYDGFATTYFEPDPDAPRPSDLAVFLRANGSLKERLHPIALVSNRLWWPPIANAIRYVVALLMVTFLIDQLKPGGIINLIFDPQKFMERVVEKADGREVTDITVDETSPIFIRADLVSEINGVSNKQPSANNANSIPQREVEEVHCGEWQVAIEIIIRCSLVIPIAWYFTGVLRRILRRRYAKSFGRDGGIDYIITLGIEALPIIAVIVVLLVKLWAIGGAAMPPQVYLVWPPIFCIAVIASWFSIAPDSVRKVSAPMRIAMLYLGATIFSIWTLVILNGRNDLSAQSAYYPELILPGHLVILAFAWMAGSKWVAKFSPLSDIN